MMHPKRETGGLFGGGRGGMMEVGAELVSAGINSPHHEPYRLRVVCDLSIHRENLAATITHSRALQHWTSTQPPSSAEDVVVVDVVEESGRLIVMSYEWTNGSRRTRVLWRSAEARGREGRRGYMSCKAENKDRFQARRGHCRCKPVSNT